MKKQSCMKMIDFPNMKTGKSLSIDSFYNTSIKIEKSSYKKIKRYKSK